MMKQAINMNQKPVTESSGNVFSDLDFPLEEVAIYTLRAELMAKLREAIDGNHWTQTKAASELGVAQSRISDLVGGKYNKFSLDMLVTLASRLGKKVELAVA